MHGTEEFYLAVATALPYLMRMSAWRRTALETLPEYRQIIEVAEGPMALWIELHLKFEEVYRSEIPDDGLIRRFYDYARWCMRSSGEGKYLSDVGTAAALAFYEHLPQTRVIRRDMHRWLTRDEFSDLREVFRCHLSGEEFARFESEFLAHGSS
jgi:hypothetical protein